MQKVWHVALNHLRILTRDRTAIVFYLLLPMLFTFITSAVFGGGAEGDGGSGSGGAAGRPAGYTLHLAVEEESLLAERVVELLSEESALRVVQEPREQLQARVEAGEIALGVVVPEGFGEAARRGEGKLLLVQRPGDGRTDPREPLVQSVLERLAAQVASAGVAVATLTARGYVDAQDPQAVEAAWQQAFERAGRRVEGSATVSVRAYPVEGPERASAAAASGAVPAAAAEAAPASAAAGAATGGRRMATGAEQGSLGFSVMFVLMGVVTAAGSLLVERQERTLARLLTCPVTARQVLGGKLLGMFLQGLVQMVLLIAAGQWIFGVDWGRSPAALAALVVAYVAAATGFGILLASLVRTEAQASAVGTLAVVVLAMLGGAWWPLEIVSRPMQIAAKFVPTGWAMDGFLDIVLRGAGLEAVWLNVAVLAGFALLFYGVGVAIFRFE